MIIPHRDKSRKRKKKNLTKKLSILNAYINFRFSKVSNSRDSKRNYFWGPDIKKNVINLKCFYIIEKRYGYDVAASMMKDGTISELMHMIYWGIEFVVS